MIVTGIHRNPGYSVHIMFHRTQNENGTFNTRCLDCLMTVATAVESPEECQRIEDHHLCAEKVLHLAALKAATPHTGRHAA